MDPTAPWWPLQDAAGSTSAASAHHHHHHQAPSSFDKEWDATVQLLANGRFVYDEDEDTRAAHAMDAHDSDSNSTVSLNGDDVELVLNSGGCGSRLGVSSPAPARVGPSSSSSLGVDDPVSATEARPPRRVTPALSGSDEARRERNRLKVRRMYYRKLERLASLRTEVSALEAQLNAHKLSQHADAHTSAPDAVNLLQRLAHTREQLQLENDYLRRVLAQYVRCADTVSAQLLELTASLSLSLSLSTAHVRIKTISPQTCSEIRRQALREVEAFRHTRSTFTDVGDVCGWHSAHLLLDGVFKFMLEKTARGFQTSTVAARTWAILRDPVRFAKLYSRAVEMKCFVLQTIDADNVVLLHEYQSMDPTETHARVVRTIVLVARVSTRSGVVFLLRSLAPATYVLDDPTVCAQDETVIWNDLLCSLEYTDAPGSSSRDCACSFAGVAPVVGGNVYFWMMEVVQLVVRWDALTLGPASYSLRADDSSSSSSSDLSSSSAL